jgi:hypothetical protein
MIAGVPKRQIELRKASSTILHQMLELLRLKKLMLEEKNDGLRKQTESVLPMRRL